MADKTNKVWTTVAQFDVYEDADAYRKELADEHELVKVKRGSKVYRVKIWNPPPEKKEKKGKKKNADKKIRN